MSEKNNQHFPFEIKDVEPSIVAELSSKFPTVHNGFVRVGPKGYFFPKKYASEAALYYNMAVRSSDVFVNTFPRSGTTLVQELVWLIENEFDYNKAADTIIDERFPYLEQSSFRESTKMKDLIERFKDNEKAQKMLRLIFEPATEYLCDAPSASSLFIKTHLPQSLLPPALADTARVIYVARDPRDVAVSYFHLNKSGIFMRYNGDFKTYWNYFIKDLIVYAPYFEHIKEAWNKMHHPNVLFLFYEELTKDMPETIRKVAKFLQKSITDEQVATLANHLKIDNFKRNPSVNHNIFKNVGIWVTDEHEQPFIRRGKAGGWRDYFDEEMTRQAEHWIAENLRGTDLRFPSMDE